MEELKIVSISDKYIDYLRNIKGFGNVCSNIGENYKYSRKYIGIALLVNGFSYYIPLSSPKKTDYIMTNGKKKIRKSIVPIIRVTHKNSDGVLELNGTLRISNMIPVPKSELELYNIENEKDIKYKSLVQNELIFIRKNKDKIISNANLLYKQKIINDTSANYVNNTLDFRALENACSEFIRRR